ncbi:hypothetical protein GVW82_004748, partial [Salmonella enterica]|nr:hypothetical protein [Salmonella enterica]
FMVNIILNMILCILSAYHIFCGVSVTQIRKLQVSDPPESPRCCTPHQHKM